MINNHTPPVMNGIAGTNPMTIKQLICIPTEHQYNDMYQRTYNIGGTNDDLNKINQFFNYQGVDHNNTVSIAAAAKELPGVVRLDAKPTAKAYIPHGWNTQRLMYFMSVDEQINDQTTITHYIQGYTEYHDPSYANKLDPNMMFYINSITEVIRTKHLVSNYVDSRVHKAYNVVSDPTGGTHYEEVAIPGQSLSLVRPSDVLTDLYTVNAYSNIDPSNIHNEIGKLNNSSVISSRKNNDPMQYFTRTVNSVITGKSIETGHANVAGVLMNAQSEVSEDAITNNAFIRALIAHTQVININFFTLNILQKIDPYIQDKILLIQSGGLIQDPNINMLTTEYTEGFLNYNPETEVVQTFINSLTATMSENFITSFSGTVTNITGETVVAVSDIKSILEGVDITGYGNRVINYIRAVIMPQLTYNNLRIISLAFTCDLLGDTTVSVSIDNGPNVVYRVPTFADSLFTPVIASEASKEHVVSSVEVITDSIISRGPEFGGYSYGY